MAASPFPGVWSADAEFTGNADFVFDINHAIWVIGNSTATGAGIFTSATQGASFTQAATVTGVSSSSVDFDPALAIDGNGVLHFVGQVQVGALIELQMFSFNPVGAVLTGPFTIASGALVPSDYDILTLSNGNCYVAACWLNSSTETVQGWEVEPDGTIAANDILITEATRAGSRYGSVSLWTQDGSTVEIYLCAIAKSFIFTDTAVSILQFTRSYSTGSGQGLGEQGYGEGPYGGSENYVVSSPVTLVAPVARYAAGRLTVLGYGSQRYFCQGCYFQKGSTLTTGILLGYNNGTSWTSHLYAGGFQIEPTLALSASGLVLGVIQATLASAGGTIQLYNVDPTTWKVLPRTDFPYPPTVNWLRGTKMPFPSGIPWAFVAQDKYGVGRFFTGAIVPPVPLIQPGSLTGQRATPYPFSASTSFDLNDDALAFTWTLTDPTGLAVLQKNGPSATVTLPNAAGPGASTLTLTLTAVAVDPSGNPLSSTASTSVTLTYPSVAAPTIAAPSPLAAARNSAVVLVPTVTLSPYATGTFHWSQTGGTTVEMITSSTGQTLEIATAGAAVAGETLSFTLTVSDGVNTPVSQVFQVVVATRTATGETQHLNRSTWAGTISQRNTAHSWPAPTASGTVTQFTGARRFPLYPPSGSATVAGETGSYVLTGPQSVTVTRHNETWHVLTPNPAETILDAVHAFMDETLVLTSGQKLLRFLPSSPATDTDNAVDTILLSSIVPATWTTLQVTPPYAGGARVLVLTSSSGVLFLQVDTNFAILNTFAMTATTGNLYGSANVQWVRLADVEDLHSGDVLIGTEDGEGNFYETAFSLRSRSVTGVWDSTMLKNQTVETGELLFESVDSWCGIPEPPQLNTPVSGPEGVLLSWSQVRSDLVAGYTISMSSGGSFSPLMTVSSGNVASVLIQGLAAGLTYSFIATASAATGTSQSSGTVAISL